MNDVLFEIDGVPVHAAKNAYILTAALDAGIYIPNLCHHPLFEPTGACGLCVVEIEGKDGVFRACTTPVEAGMKVHVDTERTIRLRRTAAELMMAEHPEECSTCPKYGNCTLQSVEQYLGTNHARFRNTAKVATLDRSNPLFYRDSTRCVKCGRCVQACWELRGVGAIDYYKDENGDTNIGTAGLLADADCRFCGACVEVCPTGALRDMSKVQETIANGAEKAEALVPCRAECPAHVDIPRYVRQIASGRYREACETMLERVPFPATLGYVCNHACELACRRGELNEAVSIRNLKRFAVETAQDPREEMPAPTPATGKRIAIVGAGPAGLTAADALAAMGHSVKVFEAMPNPGGMLRYGIPGYRLPEEVVAGEIGYILRSGQVELKTGTRIGSVDELFARKYEAVLLAIGTHAGVRLPIPGKDLSGVWLNLDYLHSARLEGAPDLGETVIVLGGGEVAFDCAQTARRNGSKNVSVVCLEAPKQMTASRETVELAKQEGISIYPSRSFLRICGSEHAEGVETLRVKRFYFDESHRAVVETEPNSNEVLPADSVIFAVGQKPENAAGFGPTLGRNGCFLTDEDGCRTNQAGVFAAGDAVTGTQSVIRAVAGGRKAAEQIDRYLGGSGEIPLRWNSPLDPCDKIGPAKGFACREREKPEFLCVEQRLKGEGPIEICLRQEQADRESNRCLQCDLRLKIPSAKLWVDFLTRGGGD